MEQAPYQWGWMGMELPGARGCDGTYCYFDYASLPPLDLSELRGDFAWLTTDAALRERLRIYEQVPAEKVVARSVRLQAEAGALGVRLPEPFVAFMRTPLLQEQIPSCTACYFDLGAQIVKSPAGDGGHCIRFYRDQQDVLFWWLYLAPNGDHAVLVSTFDCNSAETAQIAPDAVLRSTALCAPSFEGFLYRWWIENTLWFGQDAGETPSAVQQAYLAHYAAS